MQSKSSAKGKESRVDLVSPDLIPSEPEMPSFDSRPVLWRNVSALMHKKYGKEHISQLAAESGVGLATISRMKGMSAYAQLSSIDEIAAALGVEPWQLLHPDFSAIDGANPASFSPLAMDLATQLDEVTDPDQRERAFALATQVIGLAATKLEQKPAPGPTPQLDSSR